jgi:HEAT repeat protein
MDKLHMVAAPEGADAFDPDGPLESLLSLTAHPDPRMRTAALEALTRHTGDKRAHQTLIEHISDPDPHTRIVALGLLGPFVTQWPGAEEAVMAALQDPAPQVRQLALLTLSETAGFDASEPLHKALHDADPGVRTRAEELLRNMTSENSDHYSSTAGSRDYRTE